MGQRILPEAIEVEGDGFLHETLGLRHCGARRDAAGQIGAYAL